jgi:hypothetical protein
VNCHLVLLCQLCEKNNIKCDRLAYYVSNRCDFIKQIIKENDNLILRDEDIKNEVICLLYGKSKPSYKSDLLTNLLYDITYITKRITEENPELYAKIEKQKKKDKKYTDNLEGSLLSIVCQYYENKILECMHEFLTNKKVIERNNCVLCFDGIMIPRNKQYNTILEDIEKYIFDKTGFNIKLKIKSMDEAYNDLPDTDDSYEKIKEEFEKNHFKLRNPILYVEVDDDKKLIIRKKKEFMDVYENKLVMDYTINKKVSFIDKWMKDENIITYNNIDFLPKIQAPPHIYNQFNGFEIDKHIIEDKEEDKDLILDFDDDNDEEDDDNNENNDITKSLLYQHLFNLCGRNDEVFKYVLFFLSRKVKQPTKLTNTALLFKSKQGCGKDTFFNWFGRNILGNQYYYNDSNTELIFGRFNSSIDNKILVVVNESNGAKNFVISDTIKDKITTKQISIERKGLEAISKTNCISYIFFSNNDNPLQIPSDDRRFVAIECNNSVCNNEEYFKNLNEEIENKTYDILFYKYLLSLDSDDYNFTNNRPQTNIYNDMKEANKPVIISFLEYIIQQHNINKEKDIDISSTEEITAYNLFNMFLNYIQTHNFKCEMTTTKFGLKLKEFDEIITRKHTKTGNKYIIDYDKLEQFFIEKGYIKYD